MNERNERAAGAKRRKPPGPSGAGPPRRPGSTTPLRIYKPGQGAAVRWGTVAGAGIISVAGANYIFEQMAWFDLEEMLWVKYLVPVVLVVVLFYVIYRLVGRGETVVNFMIATEGEMKKVSWSNPREVIGATKVVIVTTLAMAAILFTVDIGFMMAFSAIDVLQIDLLGNLLGGDEGSR